MDSQEKPTNRYNLPKAFLYRYKSDEERRFVESLVEEQGVTYRQVFHKALQLLIESNAEKMS